MYVRPVLAFSTGESPGTQEAVSRPYEWTKIQIISKKRIRSNFGKRFGTIDSFRSQKSQKNANGSYII